MVTSSKPRISLEIGGGGGGCFYSTLLPNQAYDKIFDDDVAVYSAPWILPSRFCTRIDFYLLFILCVESINSRPIGSEAEDT
jgi:hypothetical protein